MQEKQAISNAQTELGSTCKLELAGFMYILTKHALLSF